MSWAQSSSDYNTGDERFTTPVQETYVHIYDGEAEPIDELAVIGI